jgi:hypothetical protein
MGLLRPSSGADGASQAHPGAYARAVKLGVSPRWHRHRRRKHRVRSARGSLFAVRSEHTTSPNFGSGSLFDTFNQLQHQLVPRLATAGLLCRVIASALCAWGVAPGCAEEADFQIRFQPWWRRSGISRVVVQRRRAAFDSVCTDRELYEALVYALEDDSLAVLSRRIHNPIDSADVVMTVGRYSRDVDSITVRYELELYMHREGDQFWIVAHRLTRSLP